VITIPFVKAHGARNDFLLTWRDQISPAAADLAATARAICDRNSGAGADGWILLSQAGGAEGGQDCGPGGASHLPDAAIELYNSDGSRSEISGNGTRCAAALLIESGHVAGPDIRILTGAGVKHLKLLENRGLVFSLEMNMGKAQVQELHSTIAPAKKP
jgi:diaminopimelate epimerase